jgi:HK97 family phage major capsid protein
MSTETQNAQPTVRQMREEIAEYEGAIKALQEKGGDDLSDLTEEEAGDLQAFLDARDDLIGRLSSLPTANAVKARVGSTRPAYGAAGAVKGSGSDAPKTPEEESAVKARSIDSGVSEWEKFVEKGPFKSLAHFAVETRACGERPGQRPSGIIAQWHEGALRSDAAIKSLYGEDSAYKAQGLNEFADSEGGALVPLQFSADLWKRSLEDDFNFLSLVSPISVSGNSYKVRAYDDKSRADGSRAGGVRGYWQAEAAQYTKSQPTFRTIDLKLEKLTVLVYATEEMLEDTVGLESEINRCASDEIRFKVNDAMFRGTGAGMPLGLLNAGCKIAAASNNGANNTISATDIDNMWRRRGKPSGLGYVWLANQDTEEQLSSLRYVSGSTPYAAVWRHVPGEPMRFNLKGRPLYYTEFNETLGTEGDLILIDPTQYAVAVKSSGVKSSVSMHLRFDYDELAFKFAFRMDARPYWESPLTRFKGSDTLSPIITLETTRSS